MDDTVPVKHGAAEELVDYHVRRNYDVCMVFKCKTRKDVRFDEPSTETRALNEPNASELSQMQMWKQRRESILKSLQNCGLRLYCFYSRDRDEILVKIGASPQKLRDTAARMKYKLQLKPQYLSAYAEYRHDFPGRPERQFKDRRIVSHIYKSHAEDELPDSDAIFKPIDKIHLIHHIITSKDKECAGINVGKLIHEDELKAYFPLHEAQKQKEFSDKAGHLCWLWLAMYEDHAERLRDYFGEKIAFYFLFMGFYLKWLVPLAVIGLVLQVLDWLARTPDNATAIPFCILTSIWATFLPYIWRRQEAKYAISWGTLDLVDTLEPCRPEHTGEQLINPVTAQVEPYYSSEERCVNYFVSGITMVFAGALSLFITLLFILARHVGKTKAPGGIVLYMWALALVVGLINGALTWLSEKLTAWENHRTQQEHDTHKLSKVAVLKFLNEYAALYYVAFYKRNSVLFGFPMNCLRDECFLDLQAQLIVFVLFRLIFVNLFREYIRPKITVLARTWQHGTRSWTAILQPEHTPLELADMSPVEQEAKKAKFDNFNNADEILIMHGFATLFAVTSPWVCLATLFSVAAKILVDMRGLLESKQRPRPIRGKNNEPWSTAFDIYGVVAAFTNVCLLIFTSDQYTSWTFTEKLTLFVFLGHMIILSRIVLKLVFPEVPRNVVLLQLKQENMVHRCLENIKVEQHQDFSMFRDRRSTPIEVFEHDLMEVEDGEDAEEPQASLLTMPCELFRGVRDSIVDGFWSLGSSLLAFRNTTLRVLRFAVQKLARSCKPSSCC